MIEFDDIKKLPVSEEWIAAYMDGKLDAATSALVESNLIDSPEHADFVESLRDIWNTPEISMVDFGASEMNISEASMIDDMELPSIDTDDLYSGLNSFNDSAFMDVANFFPSVSSCGDDLDSNCISGFGVFDENNDVFWDGSDIFSDDSPSLDIDTPEGMDDLPDNLS